MKKILGIILLSISFVFAFFVMDYNSNLFYKDRPYTLIEKHQSEHLYKGKYTPDYYFTIKYHDDNTFWVKNVSGVQYFSESIGNTIMGRTEKYSFTPLLIIWLIMVIGALILLDPFILL